MADNGQLVDAKQAAILLGVSDRTIRRWKHAGRMPEPAVRINHKCHWRYDDLKQIVYKRTEADKSGQDA
jgi:excisionase family DNA binding protein